MGEVPLKRETVAHDVKSFKLTLGGGLESRERDLHHLKL